MKKSPFTNKFISSIFSKLFAMGFFIFWFGFLIFAAYICLRDENYVMLLYSGIFWIAGILFAKRKFFHNKQKKTKFGIPPFGIVLLVVSWITLIIVGAGLLIQGFIEKEFGLIFMGGFFFFGAVTFLLGILTLKGCFDKCKIDVLGLYVGIFFIVLGSGIIAMIYQQPFGFWMIIPILLIIAGVIQVVKCLKKENRK